MNGMWILAVPYLVLGFIIAAYVIGSIPFGLILGKLFGAGDIRKIGSGNIGATNMLRTGRKELAAATLLLDMAKGFVATYWAIDFWANDFITAIVGIVVVLGHIFPVWLKFKGGKGVATTLGVFFASSPLLGSVTIFIWLSTFITSRYSSLSAIISIGISPLVALIFTNSYIALMALVLALMVIAKHKDNIKRLCQGMESKWRKTNEPS